MRQKNQFKFGFLKGESEFFFFYFASKYTDPSFTKKIRMNNFFT